MDAFIGPATNVSNFSLHYLPSPFLPSQLIYLESVLVLFCVLGASLNSIIIHITAAETHYQGPDLDGRKRALIMYFVYNLAVSDLCGCLISAPSLILQLNLQQAGNQWQCILHRGIGFIFPLCTNFLIVTICVERYLSVTYPFKYLSTSKAKAIIKLSWVLGVAWSILASSAYRGTVIELDHTHYSFDCHFSNQSSAKAIFIIFITFSFILPAIVIGLTTIRTIRTIRRLATTRDGGTTQAYDRSTWMLMVVVIVFAASYIPYVGNAISRAILGDNYISKSTEALLRFVAATSGYSNAVINPIVYLTIMRSLRLKFFRLLGCKDTFCNRAVDPCDATMEDMPEFGPEEEESVPQAGIRKDISPSLLELDPESLQHMAVDITVL
ncbi:histamine H2 receptor-like [Nematostella vectensis]|uniref:histamine H2 receptor-like n=1 Tax=Nematostella vectensis TaxID=45351 RepID=UPI002076EF6F|nr:histamine H2 receptor-like [Nematostella vectensis]